MFDALYIGELNKSTKKEKKSIEVGVADDLFQTHFGVLNLTLISVL